MLRLTGELHKGLTTSKVHLEMACIPEQSEDTLEWVSFIVTCLSVSSHSNQRKIVKSIKLSRLVCQSREASLCVHIRTCVCVCGLLRVEDRGTASSRSVQLPSGLN